MKTFFTLIICLFIGLPAQCQNWLSSLKLRSYNIPSRPVYFKYFENEKCLIFLDFKEGLSVPCMRTREISTEDSTSKITQLEFFAGKQWLLADSIKPDLVYIPAGQSIDLRNEMITIQRIDAQGQKAQMLYEDLLKIREEKCPGNSQFEIIESSKNSMLYQVSSGECEEFEPQTALTIITTPPKLMIGQYTIWRVEYTVKGKNKIEHFTPAILDWFRNITLLTGKDLKQHTE